MVQCHLVVKSLIQNHIFINALIVNGSHTHRHRFFLFIIDFVIKVHHCHTIPPNGFSVIMIRQQKKKPFFVLGPSLCLISTSSEECI